GNTFGLALRCGDSGSRAVHAAPFQACVQRAPLSITSPAAGKKSSVLPRKATGRPWTVSASASPPTRAVLSGIMLVLPLTGLGCAASAASNAGAFRAVVL